MWIKSFSRLLFENVISHSLKDSTVVIDGQNFLYQLYEHSKIPYIYGCESDKYAEYVRNYLDMFKKANIDCYFIFKGGHKDREYMCQRYGRDKDDFKPPIFMRDIYKQVLDEMGFNYTVCQFEAKDEIIAFAQRNNCPVISYDNTLCFSSITFIPASSIKFNKKTGVIDCKLFTINNFMQKNQLTEQKLAMFVAITSELYKCIPEENLHKFLKKQNIATVDVHSRNVGLLEWLKNTTQQVAEGEILRFAILSRYVTVRNDVLDMIKKQHNPGVPTKYLENGSNIEIIENDPQWFEKGVASKHIAISLINLYYHDIVFDSHIKTGNEDHEPKMISMDIIKYIGNLLTNYNKHEITIFSTNKSRQNLTVTLTDSVRKPDYNPNCSAFENGWMCLSPGLFEHFLTESLQGFRFEELENLPPESKLLMITLIYFSHKKEYNNNVDVNHEAYCVLLSYAVLSANTDEKVMALQCLRKHLEGKRSVTPDFLCPLVEFQYCLENMNYLNTLCGKPYTPTLYSKTFNGTFVYMMLRAMKTERNGNLLDGLKADLAPVKNVLASFLLHIDVYHQLMNI